MERLKGKNILIGREPGKGRLCITIAGKQAYMGHDGCVPNSVSRCLAETGKAHAKISIDSSGNVSVTNMKMQNETFVNGVPVMTKRITPADKVELGSDKFSVPVKKVIDVCLKMMPASGCVVNTPKSGSSQQPQGQPVQPTQKIFSVRHLKYIWEDYKRYKDRIRKEQKKVTLVRTGCSLFTMLSMPCISLIGPIGFIFTGIGIIGALYGFLGMKNDNSAEQLEKLNEDFQMRYVCPNHDCGRFLGNFSYRVMLNNYRHQCPYCKSKFIE